MFASRHAAQLLAVAVSLCLANSARAATAGEARARDLAKEDAQERAQIAGTVRDSSTSTPQAGVSVLLDDRLVAVTGTDGQFRIRGVAAGVYRIGFRRVGYRPRTISVNVAPGERRELDVRFDAEAVPIGLVSVVAASRRPQRLLDAPAAITVVDPARMRDLAAFGQLPLLVADLPGVHVQQGGAFEFNLNTRGFNFTNNRRMLVLVDGRDVSVPLLGNQEWSDFSLLDDAVRVELVRGPGSALYGASAFGGVLAITTPQVREAQGPRATVSGGSPSTARADVRYGAVADGGGWGARIAAGGMRGASWDVSRTDSLALRREYGTEYGVPRAPAPGYEFVPLAGQRTGAPLGVSSIASGSIDPTDAWYANLRTDRYLHSGAALTLEGGVSHAARMMSTVSTGRSQTAEANRPWARLAWTDSSFTLFAYYNARSGSDQSLSTPNTLRNRSSTVHAEGQYDFRRRDGRAGLTVGASARETRVDTDGSLLSAAGDGSATQYGALFGQAELALRPDVRLIAAARGDVGSRDPKQFSPKVALVWSPRPMHSLRAAFAQGYLVAPPLARFLEYEAGPPLDLRALEAGLRASPLGPALLGVPQGTLFTQSASVPLLALGNPDLRPERVSSVEAGYKGQFARAFVSVDAYTSRLDGFLSQLLPGANAAFAPWTAPDAIPDVARAAVQGAVLATLGAGITRRADGTTAYVLSGGNAGRATERGVEVDVRFQLTPMVSADMNYTRYDFSLADGSFTPGDSVLPNTPANSGNASITLQHPRGTRARLALRAAESFGWRSALWWGPVPASMTVDLVLSHAFASGLIASIAGNNILDQARYQFYGGSLVRRRVLASLSWTGAASRQ